MSRDDEHLEDGWGPDTPADDTLLFAYAAGFAAWMVDLARATESRFLDDDVGALDVGSQFLLANATVLRRPVRDAEWPGLVARLRDFYDRGPGGPWTLLVPWPTPDLRAQGLQLVGHPPFMLRPAGGSPPDDPPGLEIVEVHDESTMHDFGVGLSESYGAADAGCLTDPQVLSTPGTRCWVGYIEGRPMATSAVRSTVTHNHVEWIATHPDVRGRGIGAALTWRATLADPAVPAALLASDPGQPVYERMGFMRIARFTAWTGSRQ